NLFTNNPSSGDPAYNALGAADVPNVFIDVTDNDTNGVASAPEVSEPEAVPTLEVSEDPVVVEEAPVVEEAAVEAAVPAAAAPAEEPVVEEAPVVEETAVEEAATEETTE
ncbi:MAG: hypothetical protein AAFV33_14175, partial [Chloroflexota bacterium]